MNITMLDTVIAVVAILLVLSLIVESIQAAVKGILRLKARQLRRSLFDLLEVALDCRQTRTRGWRAAVLSIPLVRDLAPAGWTRTSESVRALHEVVLRSFRDIGRVTLTGRTTLESLTREDLVRVLGRAPLETVVATASGEAGQSEAIAQLSGAYTEIQSIIGCLDENGASSTAVAGLAELRELRASLDDFLLSAPNPGDVPGPDGRRHTTEDVVASRLPEAARLLDGVSSMRVAIDRALGDPNEIASLSGDPQDPASCDATKSELVRLAALLPTVVGHAEHAQWLLERVADAAQRRIAVVERWYDTVMTGFDERYRRSMRLVGILVSFGVVALLNANFFSIYHAVSRSDELRGTALAISAPLVEPDPVRGEDGVEQTPSQSVESSVRLVEIYRQFGFAPVLAGVRGPSDVLDRMTTLRDPMDYFGWLVTTLLLALGAPFWHDALESLFSLKNLVRKRAGTASVDREAGT